MIKLVNARPGCPPIEGDQIAHFGTKDLGDTPPNVIFNFYTNLLNILKYKGDFGRPPSLGTKKKKKKYLLGSFIYISIPVYLKLFSSTHGEIKYLRAVVSWY